MTARNDRAAGGRAPGRRVAIVRELHRLTGKKWKAAKVAVLQTEGVA
jgi:hypothetical protein